MICSMCNYTVANVHSPLLPKVFAKSKQAVAEQTSSGCTGYWEYDAQAMA
jgi:hypothetical protein